MITRTTFDSSANLILVKVEVEELRGERTLFPAAFDTGATFTIIPPDIALDLGYDHAKSKARKRIFTGSGVELCPLVTVKSITALGRTIKNLDVLCHDLPEGSCVDGLLGLDFLRNFDFVVKYSEGIIELKKKT
ncbi:MAG: retroviral-like aspartic protease family protein [candidate division Zixibacteria bacterium]|nr:retroviral-like aspartic protease family protein [candidate division Zixibacteria bacterium]